jgi:hypothetical protein
MHNYCSLLLMWFPFMASEPSSCDLCMHTTRAENVVTSPLLFQTYYSCAGTVTRSCTHNYTIYSVCSYGNQHICFNPTYRPWEQWLEIRSVCNPGNLISCTQVFSPDKPLSRFFDACAARQGLIWRYRLWLWGLAWERAYTSNDNYMCHRDSSWPCNDIGSYYCPYWNCVSWATWPRAKHAVLLHEGTAAPDCTRGTYNPVNFTVLRPSDWTWGHIIGIRIDGKGLDPGSLMHLKLVTVTHESSSYQVFHSFYEEMRNKFSISAKAKNLFFPLAESIAQTLHTVFVGGPTWETIGLGKQGS